MANSANVTASKPRIAGAIFYAEKTDSLTLPTSVPASADEGAPTGFTSLGYVSEDGVKNNNSPSSDNVKAWGGAIVMTSQTEKPDTFKFKLIEALNVDVRKFVYGKDNVTGTLSDGIVTKANAKPQTMRALVIDMIMTDNTLDRIVIPSCMISEISELSYNNEALGYEVTVTAFPDENGDTHIEYIKK